MIVNDTTIHCYIQMTVEYEKFVIAVEEILTAEHDNETISKINLALNQVKGDVEYAKSELYDNVEEMEADIKDIENYYRVSGNDI